MYVRITRGHLNPVNDEHALTALTSEVAAALKRLPGCRALYQGFDRARETTIAISVWDTEQQARFDRSAIGSLVERIQAAGLRMDAPEVFELAESAAQV